MTNVKPISMAERIVKQETGLEKVVCSKEALKRVYLVLGNGIAKLNGVV